MPSTCLVQLSIRLLRVVTGNTVSMCAIDLTKAFDQVNHSSLLMKPMKRRIPLVLLELLENWLSESYACVKWGGSWSHIFGIRFGVRQGSVLSPVLFSVYIDRHWSTTE